MKLEGGEIMVGKSDGDWDMAVIKRWQASLSNYGRDAFGGRARINRTSNLVHVAAHDLAHAVVELDREDDVGGVSHRPT